MDINKLVRKNIAELHPYSCARDEFKGEASVYLDANENPWNSPYNRYPDPLQWELKEGISRLKGVAAGNIFLGNGSDEPIDLLYRAFCEPGTDNVVAIEPTYGMYKVCAGINNVEYRTVGLNDRFDIDADALLKVCDANTKLIWLCSPNNPTGNSLDAQQIHRLIQQFSGIVVLDEAYIDFSEHESFAAYLQRYTNLVILQTFSKAWGSAAIRLGMAFADTAIIQVLNKIKYPYNINILTQKQALKLLEQEKSVSNWIDVLLKQRSWLRDALSELSYVKQIYPSDANFILIKVDDANALYHFLVGRGIIVRNRNTVSLCLGCIRITVGSPEENKILIDTMKIFG
ncbi:MAG: histidinol-phosphate transaminase [Bacteroidales bacterium]|jgi:histidinol-phosphate aminotransferase|nr:histidinol-phosphate transaminase [Bacteroidales bacterium]OJX90725.1 MAG: histidinol-phosphate transaminase [Paludibacter sp. 47-17]